MKVKMRFCLVGFLVVLIAISLDSIPLVIIGLVVGAISFFVPKERKI